MKTQLSIIIINYNTFELTCNCIYSIYRETKNISFEIILVDNASAECDPELFLEKFPKIVLIKNPSNEGFGRANNKGMKIAKGEYFLLLNSDSQIINNTIETGIKHMSENKGTDVYGCSEIRKHNSKPQKITIWNHSSMFLGLSYYAIFFSNPLFEFNKIRKYTILKRTFTTPLKVKSIYGGFMLLKSSVFKETKGFDPDFFLYYEEIEWCYNRIRKNHTLVFDPTNFFIHLKGKSADIINSDVLNKQVHVFASKALSYYKTGSIKYISFIFFEYIFNLPTYLLLWVLFKQNHHKTEIFKRLKSFKHLAFTIPSYSRKFNSNKKPLNLYKNKA